MVSELLDKLAQLADGKRAMEKRLEAQLRAEMDRRLGEAQVAVDVAAAEAYRAGERKSAIGRALGTKDYGTYNGTIERGLVLLDNVNTPNSAGLVFSIDKSRDLITVDRGNEHAEFVYARLNDDSFVFLPETPLWNDDFTEKNALVEALENPDSPEVKSAIAWVEAHT